MRTEKLVAGGSLDSVESNMFRSTGKTICAQHAGPCMVGWLKILCMHVHLTLHMHTSIPIERTIVSTKLIEQKLKKKTNYIMASE